MKRNLLIVFVLGVLLSGGSVVLADPADDYFNSGRSKLTRGDAEGAVADFGKAIELKPDFANAYSFRSAARMAQGDLDGAIADYSKVVELKPKWSYGYHLRGCLHYNRRSWGAALGDFSKELELNPASDYGQIRLWLLRARTRDVETANRHLNLYLAGRTPGKLPDWPLTVCRYLVGRLNDVDLLAAAKNPDPTVEAGHLCEANFYAGSKHLFGGHREVAQGYFEKAVATGLKDFSEFTSAEMELKFLKTP